MAEERKTDVGFFWEETAEGNARILGYAGEEREIVLPETAEGLPVTEVGAEAFAGCGTLEKIRFPKGLKKIGSFAFGNCESLREAVLPESLTTLENGAFCGCTSLERVTFAGELKRLSDCLFQGCTALSEVVLPKGLKELGSSAFSGCFSLGEMVFPEGFLRVSERCFERCMGLEKVIFSSTLVSVGDGAFSDCEGLRILSFGEDCGASLGMKAFLNCASLKEVSLPDRMTELGEMVFYFCMGLEKVTLPNTLVHMEKSAFWDCSSLRTVCLGEGSPVYTTEGTAFYRENGRVLDRVLSVPDGEFCIPEGVREVSDFAFYHTAGLRKVRFSKSVEKVGRSAFQMHPTLEEVCFAEGLRELGESAFYHCGALREISLPDSLEIIGQTAFGSCASLKKMTFGKGLKTIGNRAFFDCGALERVSLPAGTECLGDAAFGLCRSLETAELGGNIKNMGKQVFRHGEKAVVKAPELPPSVFDPAEDREKAFAGFCELFAEGRELSEEMKTAWGEWIENEVTLFRQLSARRAVVFFAVKQKLLSIEDAEWILETAEEFETRAMTMEYLNTAFSAEERAEEEWNREEEAFLSAETGELSPERAKRFWSWEETEAGIVLTGYKGEETEVDVPVRIGEKEVTALGRGAFSAEDESVCRAVREKRRAVRLVRIRENVRDIGEQCFRSCEGVEVVRVSEGDF